MGVLLAQDQVNEAIIDANAEIDAKWITVRKVTCNSGLPLQAEIRRVLISKGFTEVIPTECLRWDESHGAPIDGFHAPASDPLLAVCPKTAL